MALISLKGVDSRDKIYKQNFQLIFCPKKKPQELIA